MLAESAFECSSNFLSDTMNNIASKTLCNPLFINLEQAIIFNSVYTENNDIVLHVDENNIEQCEVLLSPHYSQLPTLFSIVTPDPGSTFFFQHFSSL